VREFGAASGVVLTGIGGIGKTALAGRVISRLRQDGWLIAVHEGRWNPTALIAATAAAIAAAPRITDPALAAALARAAELLTDPDIDDGPKLAAVTGLLAGCRLLVVFDDFEQNLTAGGLGFLDPATGEVMTGLADAAQAGALLVTCRYRLPGPELFLAEVPVPALSAAELRRMFLRLPALAELDPADQRLLTRAIGGHPRLIEFTDALLRGGRSSLRHVQAKLRDLASRHDIDLRQDRPVTQAVDQAMILGSADILLTELLALLTLRQAAVLAQVAVCRAPMTLDDLAFTFNPGPDPAGTAPPRPARPAWRSCGRTPPSWPTSPCSSRARISRCTRGPPRSPAATPRVTRPACMSGRWPCGCAGSASTAAVTMTCSIFPVTWPPCTATTTSPTSPDGPRGCCRARWPPSPTWPRSARSSPRRSGPGSWSPTWKSRRC
jgi:hypothetical protein